MTGAAPKHMIAHNATRTRLIITDVLSVPRALVRVKTLLTVSAGRALIQINIWTARAASRYGRAMTSVRNLPGQLILAHAPWRLGGGLIVCIIACAAAGLALLFSGQLTGLLTVLVGAAIPLGIFALAIKRDQVIFDARAGTVTLQRRTLFRYDCAVHPLHSVRRAELEDMSDTARPILTFHDRTPPYPLVEAYSTSAAYRRATDTINDWLRGARQREAS